MSQEDRAVPAIDDAVDALAITEDQRDRLKCGLKRVTNTPNDPTSCDVVMTGSIATGSMDGMPFGFGFFRVDADSATGGCWSNEAIAA